jgi:hypothetical protein
MEEWRYSSTHSSPQHKMEVNGQFHPPVAFPGERFSGSHSIGGWVGPRAGLDAVAKRKNLFTAAAGNRTPIVQTAAQG